MSPSGQSIRLGVIGLGRAFTLMLPTFLRDPRVRLVAAADPRVEACRRFEADFGGRSFSSVEDLVNDPAVEAVYISTPHQLHAEHTRLAALAGKHVLVEKPMALTLDDCTAMIEDCVAAGVHLVVGHSHSFDTPVLKARELILGGNVGQVRMIHAMNYTDFLFRPRRPEELDTNSGGGVIFSQAAHQVDVVRLLAGSPVRSVRAEIGAWDKRRPTEGAYSALLTFASGAFASLTYSGFSHFDSDEYCGWIGEMGAPKQAGNYGAARRRLKTVASPEAEARLKNEGTYGGPDYIAPAIDGGTSLHHQHFGPVLVSCDGADIRVLPDQLLVYGDEVRQSLPLAPPHIPRSEVIDELHAAVVGGMQPLHDGRWARETLRVCLAMLESGRTRMEVRL